MFQISGQSSEDLFLNGRLSKTDPPLNHQSLLRNYCTLFDSAYLSRGLTMYHSLSEYSSGFTLYIFAFDLITYDILNQLKLPGVIVVGLPEFETPELLEVKAGRSRAEYCWTCTPSTIWHVLKKYQVAECTYVDSDLYFYSNPETLISELDKFNKKVLISEHRFSFLPRLYEEKRAGRFCVQFMTFRNEADSLKVLDKWRLQCIDWCYARYEDGKFGDQKYLDNWPADYSNVHILENQGGGVAPWNTGNYKFYSKNGSLKGNSRRTGEFNVVFYHFQYVKFMSDGSFDIGWYCIPSGVKKLFYRPYLRALQKSEALLKRNEYFRSGSYLNDSFKGFIKSIAKKVLKYNIITI